MQDNHSRSAKGRGAACTIKSGEPSVSGVRGAVFDVVVDISKSSPTFGKWVGVELTEDNHRQFWIPAGFAHGYVALSNTADLLYKTTDYYAPEHERCIVWNDPAMAIQWLLEGDPVLSAKGLQGTSLAEAEHFA